MPTSKLAAISNPRGRGRRTIGVHASLAGRPQLLQIPRLQGGRCRLLALVACCPGLLSGKEACKSSGRQHAEGSVLHTAVAPDEQVSRAACESGVCTKQDARHCTATAGPGLQVALSCLWSDRLAQVPGARQHCNDDLQITAAVTGQVPTHRHAAQASSPPPKPLAAEWRRASCSSHTLSAHTVNFWDQNAELAGKQPAWAWRMKRQATVLDTAVTREATHKG